jgi:hypothetical protein
MTIVQQVLSPDTVTREVLFAVELVDPVTNALVHRGVTVTAAGLSGQPIVSLSGRFVWLRAPKRANGNRRQDEWPSRITVTPHGVPYTEHRQLAPPRPADQDTATAAERLLRIRLRPTPAYDFPGGVTVVRGRLVQDAAEDSPAMAGVRVELAWRDDVPAWHPPPPPAAGGDAPPTPPEVETDANGEFAVHLRLQLDDPKTADIKGGLLKVRLQFTRGLAGAPVTRMTPENYPFLSEAIPPTELDPPLSDAEEAKRQEREGRVWEGRLLGRDLRLAWTDLNPV